MKKKALFYLFFCVVPFVAFPQWSDSPYENTMINDSSGSQAVPMVVTNSNGDSYVSWYSATEGNRYDVFLQKVDKNGNKLWDDAGLLISNHETMSWVTTYDIILDNDENIILATQDLRTGNSNIFAYKISPDGNFLWGNDGIQLSNTPGFHPSPKIALAENNDVVFMFGEEPPDTLFNSTVFVKRISPDGTLLWETKLADTTYDYISPQILPTTDNGFVVSWMTKTNILDTTLGEEHYMHAFAQKLDTDGNEIWEDKVQIDSGNIMLYLSLYSTPYLANDGDGGAYVLWQSFTPIGGDGNSTTYLNRLFNDGSLWKPNGYNVSQLSGSHHSAAEMIYMENLNQVMVCWQEYEYLSTDCWGVYGQMFDADGQYLWNQNGEVIVPLLCSVDTAYFNVRLRESTDNNAVVVYQKEYLHIEEGDTAIIDQIFSMSIDADGEAIWNPEVVPLSLTSSYKMHKAMGNLVNNQWVVVWEDNIENPHNYYNTGIYAQNITVEGEIGPLGIFSPAANNEQILDIFPNPSRSLVNIKFKSQTSGTVQIDVMDVNNRLISRRYEDINNTGTYATQLNVSGLEPGIYLISLQTENVSAFGKLIKK